MIRDVSAKFHRQKIMGLHLTATSSPRHHHFPKQLLVFISFPFFRPSFFFSSSSSSSSSHLSLRCRRTVGSCRTCCDIFYFSNQMETFRPRKSPLSDRFLTPFSSSESLTTNSSANDNRGSSGGGWELEEGDVFWIGTEFSGQRTASRGVTSPSPSSPSPPQGSFRRLLPEKSFGILAALPEDDNKSGTVKSSKLLQRKSSISSSTSTSPSSSSSRVTMMIPVIPKPRVSDYGAAFSMPGGGRLVQQSAPVNIPVVPRRVQELERDDGNDDDDEMLPPHEIVARASAKETPMTTFSVLEGVGRTLKGRDLRRVRNAVWRQTGFLD